MKHLKPNSWCAIPGCSCGGKPQDAHLVAAAPEMYELLSQINTAFYTRSTRKEWLELMEKTKPLLQKARGEL